MHRGHQAEVALAARVSRPWRPAAALIAAALLLSACTFEETKPGLDVSIPKKYDFGGTTPAAPPPTDWPRLFGSPELTRLAAAAARGNLDVAIAAARIVQAQAQTEVASAPQFPTLDGSSNAQRSWSPPTIRTRSTAQARALPTTANNLFQLGLTASYEVDFWGKNAYSSEAAAAAAIATQYNHDTVVLSSVASVVNSYFTLLSAQDRLKIAEENLKAARFVLEAIKGRLSVGTVTELEVAEQESLVAQQLAGIPPLQLQADQARIAIAQLSGRTPESVKVAGGSLASLKPPGVPSGLPAQVLRRRPDVAGAEETLFSSDASVQSARAAFFPSIALTGNGGVESLVLRNLLRPEALVGTISAGLTQPLFDGYRLQGQLDQARGLRQEDLETYRKAIIQAFVDVENALAAIRRETEHERRLADVVSASKRAYTITLERLKLGTIDIVTVLNTQATLFNAQDALAVARLARFQAIASLMQALGGGWTHPDLKAEPAVVFPAPLTHGLPGAAILPPNEAATETHALPGQPPIPGAGPDRPPGLAVSEVRR